MKKNNVVSLVGYKIKKGIPHYNPELFQYLGELPEDEQKQAMQHLVDQQDQTRVKELKAMFGIFGSFIVPEKD